MTDYFSNLLLENGKLSHNVGRLKIRSNFYLNLMLTVMQTKI
jgi:hypothetical protein